MVSTNIYRHNINTNIVERRISEIQNAPGLIKKELLLDSYKKHLNFEKKLMERDVSYAKLIKTLSISMLIRKTSENIDHNSFLIIYNNGQTALRKGIP